MTLRLFDSHTHIQMSQFDGDRGAAVQRARDAGLEGMLVLGTDLENSRSAVALAEAEPGVFAAAGCHPHDAGSIDAPSLAALAGLASLPQVAAVGEIGLDFYRNYSPQAEQVAVFERQLRTAVEVAKPVAVHCRDAVDTLFPLIETWANLHGHRLPDGRPLGVMHYFSGDLALAQRFVELGFVISIHTSVTHPKAQALQDVAKELPLASMVVETDSPYGAPQSKRGKRNEPAYVGEAVQAVAALRNERPETVAAATTDTALRLLTPVSAVGCRPTGSEARAAVAKGTAAPTRTERSAP